MKRDRQQTHYDQDFRLSSVRSVVNIQPILVAEPRASLRESIMSMLRDCEFRVIPAHRSSLAEEVAEFSAEMAVVGPTLANVPSLQEIGEKIRQCFGWFPLMLLVSHSTEELAIAALKAGFTEYLAFPCGLPGLADAVRRSLRHDKNSGRLSRPLSAPGKTVSMIGESRPMQAVKTCLTRAASTDSNILITGETGTGKELAADFVHRHSPRRNKPFVTVNCAAVPDSLLESELFGYERGAFTGAQTSRDGKLKAADGGTVFLDEIGDMSPCAQAKILRAIDSKEIQRLGGTGLAVDVRIVAATNQDLETLVRSERFRKDLYFRLNVARVHLPPLRERKEDIPSIVSFYLSDFNNRFGRHVSHISDSAWEHFLAYDWPGNVRELRNLLESILIHTSATEISPDELPRCLREHVAVVDDERKRLISALVSTNWNKSRAADKLKWSRMTLYRKMAKYQVIEAAN